MSDRFAEMNRLVDLSTQILDETGEFIHAMPYRAGSYNGARRSCSKSVPSASTCEAEAAALLAKAREFLEKAEDVLSEDEAGRAAYLAGLHPAQALGCLHDSVHNPVLTVA